MSSESRPDVPLRPLPDDVLDELSPLMQEARYERGDVIIARGKPGRGLFFVKSGSAEAMIRDEHGDALPLGRFGPGTYFGEMALLTGERTSADVLAAEDCAIGIVLRPDFERLLAASPVLGRHFATTLADRLGDANRALLEVHRRQSALSDFLRHDELAETLVAESRRMKKLLAATHEAAQNSSPVLVLGEAGVGKRSIARLLHDGGPRQDGPLIAVECSRLGEDDAVQLLFGSDEPHKVSRYASRLGYLHLADGGTLVLAHIDVLSPDAQAALALFLTAGECEDAAGPPIDVQVVALTRRTREELAEENALAPQLLACFGEQVLEVPSLRRRKGDIIPLATRFLERLARATRQETKQLSADAQRKLLSYDYAHGNASELREAVERAAQLSDGDAILGEHVFLGATGGDEAGQIDLLRAPVVRRAARRGFYLHVVRALTGLAFGAIIVVCLFLPDTNWARWANLAVWCVWWPLLVLSFFPLGRVWCSVCPLSWWGSLAQRLKRFGVTPPSWLKRWSATAVMVGFLLIIWAEHAARMPENAFATGVLLSALVLGCVVAAVVFQRQTWCRYLCPLGAMGATFATCAIVRLRANRDVCATQCTTHECFKGTAEVEGCPVFHHALFVENSQNCKLCMKCLQTCPNESIRVYVQSPLRDLWRPELGTGETASFAVVLGGGALALMLSRSSHPALQWVDTAAGFGLACGVVLAAGLVFRALTQWLNAREREGTSAVIVRLAHGLVPLFWGVLFAYHLGSNGWLADYSFTLAGADVQLGSLELLRLAQGSVIVIGALLALYGLWRVYRAYCAREGLLAQAACLTTVAAALGYMVAGLTASA